MRTWLRLLVLVIVGFTGAILFSKTKVQKEDCSYYKEQNKQLIGVLIQTRTMVDSIGQPLSANYKLNFEKPVYAIEWAGDTLPKKMTPDDSLKFRIKQKLDSVIKLYNQKQKT